MLKTLRTRSESSHHRSPSLSHHCHSARSTPSVIRLHSAIARPSQPFFSSELHRHAQLLRDISALPSASTRLH